MSYDLVKDKNEETASDNPQPAGFRTKRADHDHEVLRGRHPSTAGAIFVLDSGQALRRLVEFANLS
jgi:hypothetical protein